MALSMLAGRFDYSDGFLDAVYRCQMDGSCDISCKTVQDIEPLQMMQELRIRCVQDGQSLPAHIDIIDSLKKQDNMMKAEKQSRGKWAEDLDVKDLTREKGKVLFHAGCRYSFDEELWPTVRMGLNLLRKSGVDVGIMGREETCCAGRAYELGYSCELTKYAEHNAEAFRNAGIETVVTPCSDCYHSFKVLYEKIGKNPGLKVLHITECLNQLIKDGKIKLKKKVPMTVTYHDPCHLGRLGEPWVDWRGKEMKVMGQLIVHDPPKKYRRGANGVYEIPRELIAAIPGIKLNEMYRIKEYAWCCGSGGGVKEAYPDFAIWTGEKRLKEAAAVGAEAIVSACPWCTTNFRDTARETGDRIKVFDLVDLIGQAV